MTKLVYRPEIDGLRAVAVMAVMLFHAGIPGFSGGFVGVDVFFVISGYLITGILLRELNSDSFSLVAFYERRIRRILPALFLVMLVCISLGWLLMSPWDLDRLGQSLMAVTSFVSNILFWKTTDYFTATVENPLLHTWSLGVEEQFYIFFPLFLWVVWRYARDFLSLSIVGVAVASLVISEWGVWSGRLISAFYLSPTRAFELLLGSLVAVVAFRGRMPSLGRSASCLLVWVGFGCIVWSTTMFSQKTPFPGWHALVPSIGTTVILAFVRVESFLGRLLSWRVMVGLGLISYSAYLWHQPVFAFTRIAGFKPSVVVNLGLLMLSLALAWLSWRYIEQPFRDKARISRRVLFWWAGIVSIGFLGGGAWLAATDGVPSRYTEEELRWWEYANVGSQSDYVIRRFNDHSGNFILDPRKKILIIGDSFSQDFFNMMYEVDAWHGAQVRTVYIPYVCQIANAKEDARKYIAPVDEPICVDVPDIRSLIALIKQADVIVLAARWKIWSAELLPQTIVSMDLSANQSVFVLGPKEFSPVDIHKLLRLSTAARSAQRHQISDEISAVNRVLAANLSPGVFIDQIHVVCGSSERCPLVTDEGDLISYDGGHLTRSGARYIGHLLFSESALANVK
ncbi:acyltransferase family protein [Castellaniella sp.]|uniref:acyltransferase family protein n=1 Tax=Castellaniella sp. TaxID=1955812 RepID=UPI003D0F7BCB